MKTKFTKGEWKADYFVVTVDGKTVADCGFSAELYDEQEEANVHLIAAAPDMYKFLEGLQLSVADEIKRDELLEKARGE